MKIPRIVVAGATSGVGKTSITCGIIHGMQSRGYSVQPFKVGPDYIDPSYLSNISGNDACNLDAWLMGRNQVLDSFASNSNSDISVIEGVMGFYDGATGDSNFASTHHVASITKSPVVLVLDASKTSRSIAATALGFQKFHKSSHISGVILNKIGSKRHELLCRQALEKTKLPVLGVVYRNPELKFESRHMGLIPASASTHVKKKLVTASKIIADSLDIQEIIKIASAPAILPKVLQPRMKKPKAVISVALDSSFNFYYRDNLDALQREGAILKFFSPIADDNLSHSDGIYIGGGFPEVLASGLERNRSMRYMIRQFSEDGMPIYAECGGLMYLTKSIRHDSKTYAMAGIFDAETVMTKKMKLNYTRGKILSKNVISEQMRPFYGHEFHYSRLQSISPDSKFAYRLDVGDGIRDGMDGLMAHNTLASYGHLYFDRSDCAKIFVKNCKSFSRK
ncbi:MAG: cobyrinate a,c-diamide synthase [Thaumarchaeota archaeon]|nr:cobyrinate a,c-diamide synthase [Nitrososphaerota archaeon]